MISIITTGVTAMKSMPTGDVVVDCRWLPDPSPVVHDLPGVHPEVWRVIEQANPMAPMALDMLTDWVTSLNRLQPDVRVVLFCSAGWHRSVALAEKLAQRLRMQAEPVEVLHLELDGVAT